MSHSYIKYKSSPHKQDKGQDKINKGLKDNARLGVEDKDQQFWQPFTVYTSGVLRKKVPEYRYQGLTEPDPDFPAPTPF